MGRTEKYWKILCVALVSVCIGWSAAAAEETPAVQKDWQFQLAPFYLWYFTVSGDQTIGTSTSELDVSLGNLISGLEAAFIANFQGFYKNKWGFFFDYNYAKIGGDTYQGRVNLDVNMKLQLAELSGMYRITPAPDHALDVKAGARYMGMDPTVKITPPVGYDEAGGKQDWVDPVVGLRWLWNFADQWHLALSGDVGGFGVGSDFTWQGALTIDWQPFENVSFLAGYRALYVDYEDGTRYTPDYFQFDATMHGPLLGVAIHW